MSQRNPTELPGRPSPIRFIRFLQAPVGFRLGIIERRPTQMNRVGHENADALLVGSTQPTRPGRKRFSRYKFNPEEYIFLFGGLLDSFGKRLFIKCKLKKNH